MKKLLALILSAGMLLSASPRAQAATERVEKQIYYRSVTIELDGETLVPTNERGESTEPFIIDGSTYLPVRALAKALGFRVDWSDSDSTVLLESGGERLPGSGAPAATQGSRPALLTYRDIRVCLDGKPLLLKNAAGESLEPFIMDDSTYLPVRALAGALGLTVEWVDSENKVVLESLGCREERVTELVSIDPECSDVILRTETLRRIYPDRTETEIRIGKNLSSRSVESRDALGRVTEILNYDPAGTLIFRETFSYSEDGLLVRKVHDHLTDDQLDSCTLYEYKNGILAKTRLYERDTVPRVHSTDISYSYDSSGQLVRLYVHYPNGSWDETLYEYSEDGSLLSERSTFYNILNGNTGRSYALYEYENGLLARSETLGGVTLYFYAPGGVLEKTVTERTDGTYVFTFFS